MGILDILGITVKPITDYINQRQILKSQEHANELAALTAQGQRQAELKKAGQEADAAWELEFARQAANSWKDEYTLIVISIPCVMAFVPKWAPYVARGFEALDKTPTWYQLILGSIFLATYGIRYWRRTQSDS